MTFDFHAVHAALISARDSDEPTTATAAKDLGTTVTENLEHLRGWIEQIQDEMSEADEALDGMIRADHDDRGAYHDDLTSRLYDLCASLDETKPAPETS